MGSRTSCSPTSWRTLVRGRAADALSSKASRARRRASHGSGAGVRGRPACPRGRGPVVLPDARRGAAARTRGRRHPVGRLFVRKCAGVRAPTFALRAHIAATRAASRRAAERVRRWRRPSNRTPSSDCALARSASERYARSCNGGSAGRSHVRRCAVCTRSRAVTPSMRSSLLVSLTRQARPSIRWSRFRFRRRWSGWWAPASPDSGSHATRRCSSIAAHGRPSPALLGAAGISPNALEPAFAAQVVELSTDAVRFTHPLLASILYQEAPDEERRSAHGRLAAVVDDPVERARTSRLPPTGPTKRSPRCWRRPQSCRSSRGASVAAAELAEHALRLTPSEASEDRDRRTIAAARAHFDAGDARRARALALELHARPPAGRRAEALVLLSDIEGESGRLERSIELRREALEAAAGQPTLLVEIHQWLGNFARFTEGEAAGDRHAAAALELAEALGDDSLRAGALSVLAFGRFRAGLSGRAVSGRADRSACDVCRRPATAARDQLHGREPASSGRTSSTAPGHCCRASTVSGASATSLRRRMSSGGWA